MTRADYVEVSEKALRLFEYGQVIHLFHQDIVKFGKIKEAMKCLIILTSNMKQVNMTHIFYLH